MKDLKKKNIVIGIILFFIMIGFLGYSHLKTDEVENEELTNNEEQLDEEGFITLGDEYEEFIINVPGVQSRMDQLII